jgi:bifunctional non-homologous end joining protein LigD
MLRHACGLQACERGPRYARSDPGGRAGPVNEAPPKAIRIAPVRRYFATPCLCILLASLSRTVPNGPQWAYEIKHDGFRFICHRDGDRVRVFSLTGRERSAQLPRIVAALRALR